MIYGYIRVSSDKQTVENQRFEISNFCEHQNLSIDDWIEETISGTKNYTKRQLGNLLKKINKDDIIIWVHPRFALVLSCKPSNRSLKYSSSL